MRASLQPRHLAVSAWRTLTTRSAVKRMTKFGVVGVIGVGINLGVFTALTSGLGLHYLIAGAVAVEIALCSNYFLNNTWTFADRSHGVPTWAGLWRYQVVGLGGLLINLGVLHVLAGSARFPLVLANLAGIVVATSWNFALSLGWTWRPSGVRPLNVNSTTR